MVIQYAFEGAFAMRYHARLVTVAGIFGISAIVLAETREFSGDTTKGWIVVDAKAGKQANEKLTASDGWLHLKYDRANVTYLGHMTPITNLKELKIVLRSDVDA